MIIRMENFKTYKRKGHINLAKIVSILLALQLFFFAYSLTEESAVSISDVIGVFICVLTLINGIRRKLRTYKPYFLLYFACMLIPSIIGLFRFGMTDPTEFFSKWARIVVYYFIIDISSRSGMDFDTFETWSIRGGMLVSVLLLVQVIVAMLFSKYLSFYLDFMPMVGPRTFGQLESIYQRMITRGEGRFNSIFTEPQQVAIYTLLPLAIVMFSRRVRYTSKRKLAYMLVMTAAILLSTSATGIFLTILLWGIYYYRQMKTKGRRNFNAIVVLVVLTVLAASALLFLFHAGFIDQAMSRVEMKNNRGIHLFQGLAIFKQMPLMERIFGVGYGNIVQYLTKYNITTEYSSSVIETMNGGSEVLLSSGIVGVVLFMCILMRLYSGNKLVSCKVALLLFSILMCTTSMFYSANGLMYLPYIRCGEGVHARETPSNCMKNACGERNLLTGKVLE